MGTIRGGEVDRGGGRFALLDNITICDRVGGEPNTSEKDNSKTSAYEGFREL